MLPSMEPGKHPYLSENFVGTFLTNIIFFEVHDL